MIRKIFAIFLVFSSFLFLGCKKQESVSATALPVEILNQDSSQTLQKLKDNLSKAKEASKVWRGDAQFIAIVLKAFPETSEETLTETFVFGSPEDANNWWTYSLAEQTGKVVRSITPKEDYLGTDFQPIKEEYWQISYIEALAEAEKNGGTSFRADNPSSQINMVLAQTNPKGWLWWQIEYKAASSNLKILVNAADGKAYNESGELIQ